MSNLINLVLLYGGKSGEHEVSLMSAASVLTHLRPRTLPYYAYWNGSRRSTFCE